MTNNQAGQDEPPAVRRIEDGELVYTTEVELALPAGPLVLAVDFHVEHDELDVSEPADVATGRRSVWGRINWWGTIALTVVPPQLWDALGSRVPIRTRVGGETHVLVSKIEPPAFGVGADIRPSVVRLDGSGPLPAFHDVNDERDLLDATAFKVELNGVDVSEHVTSVSLPRGFEIFPAPRP